MLIDKFKKHPWLGLLGILAEGTALGFCFIPMALVIQQVLVFILLTTGFILNIRDYLKIKNKIHDSYTHNLVKIELVAGIVFLIGVIPAAIFSTHLGAAIALTMVLLNMFVLGFYANQVWQHESEAGFFPSYDLPGGGQADCLHQDHSRSPRMAAREESTNTSVQFELPEIRREPAASMILDNGNSLRAPLLNVVDVAEISSPQLRS